jgi:glycosyltransferase involved in cell wall biosynthesis
LKISIVTVVWNNEKTVKNAIDSVLSQTYKDVEYIVVDGASTDGTVDIVKSYGESISKFISEPDKGIYDAMNKGVKLATGEIIGILNSDDFYSSNSILETIVSNFLDEIDAVYGDLTYVDSIDTSKVIRYWKSQKYKKGLFQKGWHPAHPTFFVKRELYEKYGIFNLEFKIASDYELMLRFIEKHGVKTEYIPKIIVNMRVGGTSNSSIKNIAISNYEVYKSWKINGLKISPMIALIKPFSKIKQLFLREKSEKREDV